jgi:hypothetical protein
MDEPLRDIRLQEIRARATALPDVDVNDYGSITERPSGGRFYGQIPDDSLWPLIRYGKADILALLEEVARLRSSEC